MRSENVPRHPLAWPEGWPRTKGRRTATFKVDFDKAVRDLGYEVERLGGRYPVMSTNLELRIDGGFRRNAPPPQDPGVAVYFELKGKQKVFACDTFNTVRDNVRAIGLTIAAMRGMERYGATSLLDRALSAFEALPARHWMVLGVEPGSTATIINAAYKRKAIDLHPDKRGGDGDAMAELNAARDAALKAVSP